MKYLSIVIASFLLFSISDLKAQKDSEKPSTVIFTAGWSYADLNQGDESTDSRNGLHIGLRKDIKLFPTMHLETGALYVQKGATFDLEELGTLEYQLDYIDIPAALKFKFGGLYALGGVSGNIRIKSEVEGEKVDNINPFSLSSSLGAGFKFLMFSIDARWNHTLTDIVKDNDGDKIYNSYFLIGLSFHLQRK
ncbi:outer membrane beta-barrel protein [Cryomorphaceae bacterium 1068]|nr:outer membrane beta-barrel protein [Cryomorphaceae bacterium 1068]